MNRRSRRTSTGWIPAGPSPAELLLVSIPMLDQTSDAFECSNDWPDAFYEAKVKPDTAHPGQLGWIVQHTLKDAPGIEALLASGHAKWAVEYRCAETMQLGAETSRPNILNDQSAVIGTTRIALNESDIGDGTLYLWPGVITVNECDLNAKHAHWGQSLISVGAGRWLVRGSPVKAEHQGNSPIIFRPDNNIVGGKVTITTDSTGQDTRFIIRANPDRIDLLKDAKTGALLGCWATALAMLPYQDAYKIERDDAGDVSVPECELGNTIITKLRFLDPELPLWDEVAEWDPMSAATLMLELPEPPSGDDA